MDYSKLTKQELIDLIEGMPNADYAKAQIEALEKQKEELEKAMKDQIKARDESIIKVKDLEQGNKNLENILKNKEIEFTRQLKEEKEKLTFMETKFTHLANLFEEYVIAFKDHNKLFETLTKTNNYVIGALDSKIKKFNEGE